MTSQDGHDPLFHSNTGCTPADQVCEIAGHGTLFVSRETSTEPQGHPALQLSSRKLGESAAISDERCAVSNFDCVRHRRRTRGSSIKRWSGQRTLGSG